MKHFFYILILCSLMTCRGIDRPKKPQNLIAEDKMVKIMYDLYILNAAKGVNRKLLERNGVMPMEYVYKKYNIDSLQFVESNTYYAYDPKVYSAIVEKVKAELERDKNKYEKLTDEEQKAKDSIKQIEKRQKDTVSVPKKADN